ncbi:MAG: hypothetical protein U0M60_17030, partial [Clostridia bacterium]|nr:hypothetical protein [Clostridia bacterium]
MKINKVLSLILAFAMILGTMTTVAFATENEKAEATMFSGPYEIVYKNVNTDKMFVDGSIYGLKESLKIVHWVTDKMEDVTFENIVSDNPELVDVNSSKEIDVKKTFTGVVTLTADATTEAGKKYKETIEVTTREIQADNDGKIGATSETIANAWDDFSALNGEQFFIGDFRELKDIYKIGFYAWDSEGNPVSVSGLAGLYTNNGWKGIDGASSTLSQITTSNVVTLFSGAMLNPYSDVLNIGFALTSEIEKDTTVMITVYNNMVSAPNYPRGNNQALAARSFKFVSNPVAKVGTAYYETLQAAATEAPDGATIEILGDTVENDWQQITDKSLTINGNGNTVTIDSVTNNTMLNGGALFRNTNNTANEANATLNISNTEFELPSGAVIAYIVDGTVDNVTVNGGKYGFVVEGATNFLGSTFNAQEKEAIYFRDVDGAPGSVVDGCTFNIENRRACALWTNEVFTNNTINTNNTEVTGLTILSDSSATVSGNVFGEDANIEIYVNGEESGTFSLTKNIIAGSVFTDGAEVSTQFENVNIENNSLSDEAVEGLKSIDEDVVSVNPAAEFNGKKYFSINEAIEAAKGSVNPEIKVLAGTYDAFEVPESLVNATFVGETDTNGNNLVTIRTLEEGIATHTGGIFVQAETATFENLDITSGEVSVNPRVG